jgi:L-idonate 5-dehydrogenase
MSGSREQAATLFGPRDLRLVAAPMPALAPGMVRVAFGAGGICGSDMHYFRHARTGDFVVKSPLVLGHEIAGTIIGMDAPADHLAVGDRVAINPSRWCGNCRPCRLGRPNLCENIYFMGSASKTPHMQGGFATHIDVIPAQCVPVPAHVPFAAAALAEPLLHFALAQQIKLQAMQALRQFIHLPGQRFNALHALRQRRIGLNRTLAGFIR